MSTTTPITIERKFEKQDELVSDTTSGQGGLPREGERPPPSLSPLSSSLPVTSSSLLSSSPQLTNSHQAAIKNNRVRASSSSEIISSFENSNNNSAAAATVDVDVPPITTSQDDLQLSQMAHNRRERRAKERQLGKLPIKPPSVTMNNISASFPNDLMNSRLRVGHADMQGRRHTMEDAMTVNVHFRKRECDGNIEEESFIGVYDGHGGSEAAEYVGKQLHLVFKSKLEEYEQFLKRRERIEKGEESVDEKELDELVKSCNSIIQRLNNYLHITSATATNAQEEKDTEEEKDEDNVDSDKQKDKEKDTNTNKYEFSAGSIPIESLSEEYVIPMLLREAFLETNEQLCYTEGIKNGTTASVTYLRPITSTSMQLYVANVGDSRVVLCRKGKAIRLSVDHRPSDPDEQRRVKDAGGYILNNRVNAILAVTRAIGDVYLQPVVTSDPYTSFINLSSSDGDEFLIVACDGVWDMINDQDAIDLIRFEMDPRVASVKLRDHAYNAGSNDNISVAVVRISKVESGNVVASQQAEQ
jgi:protein phosphatase PTC1